MGAFCHMPGDSRKITLSVAGKQHKMYVAVSATYVTSLTV